MKKQGQAAEQRPDRGRTREQLMGSARYARHRDLLSALLEDGRTYTPEEADGLIEDFRKGRVM